MTELPRALLLGSIGLLGIATTSASYAQPAPSAAHPRIWLNAATRNQIVAQAGVANGPVARGAARCTAARERPAEYATGGWQGFEFVTTLSACLTAYVAHNDPNDLATALKYWTVLLDDYQHVGDGLGGDSVVTHDTGYAMRTFAPFAALGYDWLHDAPGVTEELRAHARARFDAWSTYYSTGGYLRDLPGANYEAGYAFAATLMAVAEAGEAGAAGDAHWANVRDTIWQKDLVPAFAPGRVLDGGDWPEGWQYGSLSVLELSLAARALQDNGVSLAGASAWASSLPLRFAYGLTPTTRQSFTGGDSDAATPYRKPDNGALLAALVGPASDDAKALARKLNQDLKLTNENPLFDALADAASASAPATGLPTTAPTNYLAHGTGNWYVRGDWSAETAWGVFQCSRHLVDDHQYANAGNWVLTRGADDLVVDPSPYGSLSTLTGNAPAIDSASLPEGYSPSQGYWGKKTGLVWSRQSGSGIAAARCDYADQFQRSDVPSDVTLALRDFVMIPHAGGATVVLVDRALTGAPGHALHLRVRTPASLTLAGDSATGSVGASSLTIQKLWTSGGAANVRAMPQASECPSSSHGCDVSKLPAGSEYRVDITGPAASAIHVVSAAAGPPTPNVLLSGAGYRGALIGAQGQRVAVIGADAVAATPAISLTYRVPAGDGAVHVVLDAPVNAEGQSDVTASRDGADCLVQVKAHSGGGAGMSGRPLVVRATGDCALTDDGDQKPIDAGTADPSGGAVNAGGTPGLEPMNPSAGSGGSGTTPLGGGGGGGGAAARATPGEADGSCSFRAAPRTPPVQSAAFAASSLLGLFRLVRRRRARIAS
jgi:hypothetical protein